MTEQVPIKQGAVPADSQTPIIPGPTQTVIVTPAKVEAETPVADESKSGFKSPPLPATTTEQEDITTQGQRYINSIWEWTQAIVAITVTAATMASGIISQLYDKEFPLSIGIAFGTIIGFYFSRTNHQAIGGIGAKANEQQTYAGR